MREQKSDKRSKVSSSDAASATTEDDDDEDDDNGRNNNKTGKSSLKKKKKKQPRKDSGIHSMNSSASPVASEKDIDVTRPRIRRKRRTSAPNTSSSSSSSSVSSEVEEAAEQEGEEETASSTASSSASSVPSLVRSSRNVAQIEALLKRINEENRKTKEVLDTIHRTHETQHKETTTKVVLSRGNIISLGSKSRDNRASCDGSDGLAKGRSSSTSSSSSIEDMLFYETSADGKKGPVLMFSCAALSNPSHTVLGQKFRLSFKTVNADAKLISQIGHAHGLHEVHSSNNDYNLMWTGVHPKPQNFKSMLPHQRVNHFPRSYELTRKDRLYQNIERLQHAKGAKNFNFVPKTFMIPVEYSEFAATHHRMRGAWIVKPVASSRGRGIFIVSHPNQVPLDEPMVVGKYIDNPLLVNGHKWDLRLYVAVTSYDPLSIYLYEEGLVRFATVRYDSSGKNLWNPCMHLCNYSINKYHSDYIKCDDPDQEDQGHKWSLSALLRHLKANGIDTSQLMGSIEDVIIKSIISVEFPVNSACKMFVPHKRNCFELYGFDILIDSDLKPWLLEVNLSPSLNCEAPIDLKIKSAMLVDLLNLVGLPAVDPVLRRAQFNKRVTEMANGGGSNNNNNQSPNASGGGGGSSSNGNSDDAAKKAAAAMASHRRNVSAETRRFAAIRLAASSTSYQQELARMVRNAKEENSRRGGWVRIFPTAETWSLYGSMLEYSSQNNLILHEHLYPNATRKAQRLNRRTSNGGGGRNSDREHRKGSFDFLRKRSQSAGPSKMDRETLTMPYSHPQPQSSTPPVISLGSATAASAMTRSMSSSTSLAQSASNDDKENKNAEAPISTPITTASTAAEEKPSASELRVAQYEKSLTKGHRPKSLRNGDRRDPEKLAKRRDEKRARSHVLKEKILKMIESGLQLSEYQSRKAFSVYLHCILQRLTDFDPEQGLGSTQQVELVLKFLQKAALSLREPYFLKAPSVKLSGKDRAAIVAKELNEFLSHYRRETELFTVFKEEAGMVPRHVFEEFVAFANDSDMEDVLTLQTKLYRCAHIFLGKCLAPVTGGKNSLLRTAYGISPDRNLRDRQCTMRMNARSNPPVAPQFALPPPAPTKCLDITTYEKSKLEELQDLAEEDEGEVCDANPRTMMRYWRGGHGINQPPPPPSSSRRKSTPAAAQMKDGNSSSTIKVARGMVSAVTVARHMRKAAAATAAAVRECSDDKRGKRDVEKSGNKDGVEEGSDKVGLLSVPPVATTASASSVVRSASAPSNLT